MPPSGENTVQVQASASGRQKVADVKVGEDFKKASFIFFKGPKGETVPSLEIDLEQLVAEIGDRLKMHGAVQKIRDSYAGVKGNAIEAYNNAKEVWDALLAGDWSTRGEGDGSGASALYIEAIARLRGWSLEVTKEKVSKMTEEWRKAAPKDPQIAQAIAQIRLERAQAAAEAAAKAAGAAQPAASINLDDLDVQAA